jgi:tetratricopeptide (TPR) repeat protein
MESQETSGLLQEMVEYQKKILETLEKNAPQKKDWWDRFSAVSTLLSGIIIAAIGGYFTYSYNSRQTDLLDAQNRRANDAKAHEMRILEMQTVEKFIPHLTGANETAKNGAITALAALGNPELAGRLGASFASPGSIGALEFLLKNTQGDSKALVRQSLVNAYHNRASELIYTNKDPNQALKDHARIHELEPSDQLEKNYDKWFLSNLYNDRGSAYFRKEEYGRAADDFTTALRFAPADGIYLANLAAAYTEQGNFAAAREMFDQSFKTPPTAETYNQRGWFYFKQEDFEKAIEDFQQALAMKSDEPHAFYNLMRVYAKKDDYHNAAVAFIRVRSRLTDPKLHERLDQNLESASQWAGNAAFDEKVKREISIMSSQGEPTSAKTGANP